MYPNVWTLVIIITFESSEGTPSDISLQAASHWSPLQPQLDCWVCVQYADPLFDHSSAQVSCAVPAI